MLALILGLCIGVALAILFENGLLIIVIEFLFFILTLLPLEGFEKREFIKKVELIKLKGCITEKGIYILLKKNRATYAFDNRETYTLDSVAYEEGKVKGKIKIYECSSCEVAVLKVYKIKPNRNFVLAPFSTKTEYIFQVPEGTVKRVGVF